MRAARMALCWSCDAATAVFCYTCIGIERSKSPPRRSRQAPRPSLHTNFTKSTGFVHVCLSYASMSSDNSFVFVTHLMATVGISMDTREALCTETARLTGEGRRHCLSTRDLRNTERSAIRCFIRLKSIVLKKMMMHRV